MATDKEVKNWLDKHQKSDADNFEAIHTHLDRLDKATNNDLIIYKIDELQKQVREMAASMSVTYVTYKEFDPIKKVVYGLVGLTLMAVVGGVLALVVRGN